METRKLGSRGPQVSAIGFGAMSIGIADVYTSSVRGDDRPSRSSTAPWIWASP